MLSEQLKKIRDTHGISQEAAARKIGVSFVSWNTWENGSGNPSLKTLQAIKLNFPSFDMNDIEQG